MTTSKQRRRCPGIGQTYRQGNPQPMFPTYPGRANGRTGQRHSASDRIRPLDRQAAPTGQVGTDQQRSGSGHVPLQTKVRYWWLGMAVCSLVFYAGSLWAHPPGQPSPGSLDEAVRQLPAEAVSEGPHRPADHPHPPPLPFDVTSPQGGNIFQSFVASWRLFYRSYLVGWLAGMLLALVGISLVARSQIFIAAAVSQASTLGLALALWAGSLLPIGPPEHCLAHCTACGCFGDIQSVLAVGFSILASLLTLQAYWVKRESSEAITGWVFLISASLSVLLLAHSPHGLEEIRHVHSSTLIGASGVEVWIFGLLLMAYVGFLALAGRRVLLWITDPAMAAAVGLKAGRWILWESIWIGLVVGLSIRTAGMLFTFGSLILPPLAAQLLCREMRSMFFAAPAVALGSHTIGFLLANHFDFPPGQMNVAISGLAVLLAWLLQRFRLVNRNSVTR